jgi:TP901 family phage tail tape measure protein
VATVREFITKWGFDVDFGPLEKMEAETRKVRAGFAKIGAVATAALAAIVVPSATLEDALRRSAAAAGKTGAEFDATLAKLQGRALDFAEDLGISGVRIADGFFNVISSGLDPLSKEFDDFSETAFKLAKVTGGDVGQAVSQLNTTLNAFRATGATASTIANTFAKANTIADTSVSQLAEAMQIAGPIAAKLFTQNLSTTSAVLSAFGDAGFRGVRGGEALKQVINKLSAPTGDAAKTLKNLGIVTTNADGSFRNLIDIIGDMETSLGRYTEANQAAALKTIFGEETVGKFVSVLSIGSERMREYNDALKNSEGAVDLALEQMEGLIDVGRKAFQAIKNIAITLGSPLLGPLTSATKAFLGMVKGIRDFLKENPKLTRGLALTTGGILGLVAATAGIGVAILSFKLLRLAVLKTGTAFLVAQLKAFGMIAGVLVTGVLLFALFDDLFAFLTGQKSVIGELVAQNREWEDAIRGIAIATSVLLAGLTFLASPLLLLVVLLAALTVQIIRTRDEWGLFFDFIKGASLGNIVSEFGEWLASLVGLNEEFRKLANFIDRSPNLKKILFGIAGGIPGLGPLIAQRRGRETLEREKRLRLLAFSPERPRTTTGEFIPPATSLFPREAPLPRAALAGAAAVGGGQGVTNVTLNRDTTFNVSGDPEQVREIYRQEKEQDVRDLEDDLGEN